MASVTRRPIPNVIDENKKHSILEKARVEFIKSAAIETMLTVEAKQIMEQEWKAFWPLYQRKAAEWGIQTSSLRDYLRARGMFMHHVKIHMFDSATKTTQSATETIQPVTEATQPAAEEDNVSAMPDLMPA